MTIRRTLRRVIANPRLIARSINRLYYRIPSGPLNLDGVDIFEEDWDNLIILDGCRYDLFEEESTLGGELLTRASKGSNTVQFLRGNFSGKKLPETVYITANPQYEKIKTDLKTEFHSVINAWENERWDEELQTVPPDAMTEEVIETGEEFPDKRLLIHYNQPHVPFIGPTGRSSLEMEEIVKHPLPFWQQPMSNEWSLDDDTIREAYAENLRIVLPHIETLLEELQGRTVVTSDHGNMIGERAHPIPIREYGHPGGVFCEELVTVPWLIHETGERKDIKDEDFEGAEGASGSRDFRNIEERLEYLGYK